MTPEQVIIGNAELWHGDWNDVLLTEKERAWPI